MTDGTEFDNAFRALTGHGPFPWQRQLYERLVAGRVPRTCDVPTGLGKTAVIAIWLIARAYGAELPRRLVYVVDRRAVVDQATEVATGLREYVDRNADFKRALNLEDRSLPISTLRGQHVDNKEWLEDPVSPAIIVGTVDMIGSRLLFEGYGTSRKMRPYHAGLLGADTLVVLDEAHLVPPFEKLLETIADGKSVFRARCEALCEVVPPFKLLSLSATGRTRTDNAVGLTEADLQHPDVKRRLDATKRLTVLPLEEDQKLPDVLAKQAWKLAGGGAAAVRIIVFCHSPKDAAAAMARIEKLANGDKKAGIAPVVIETELFVGGRRVFEREDAAKWLREHGFISGATVERVRPAFVFATSAGEVGVDLDADHMVSDLVAWERMVQRLGRANRRGDGEANVIVVVEPEPKPRKAVRNALAKNAGDRTESESKAIAAFEASVENVRALGKPLQLLPPTNGAAEASSGAIRGLKLKAGTDPELQAILDAATTPSPLRPALSRALVDAWSMTSFKEHTGRPEIAPWLRGWVDDAPQTTVVWRKYLPVHSPTRRASEDIERRRARRQNEDRTKKEIEAFFEAAPPHASEILETETFRVIEWLDARATVQLKASTDSQSAVLPDGKSGEDTSLGKDDVAAVVLTRAGDVRQVLRLDELSPDGDTAAKKAKKEDLQRKLAGATLVVDARLCGLDNGLLNHTGNELPRTADDGQHWITEDDTERVIRFRVRTAETDVEPSEPVGENHQWRERFRFATQFSEEGEPRRWLIVDKWRDDATTEDDRSAGHPQLLDKHQEWAKLRASELAQRLGLPTEYTEMLGIAARLHDEGKRSERWQRAFNAPDGGEYAKTPGPVNVALLDGYRHEFGTLSMAEKDPQFGKLPPELQDLALHLIAAHHGFARPIISISGYEDAPPSVLEERAQDVAMRFARLQKRWGPWGLAWWESLLRAADQQASRDNERDESVVRKEDD